MTILEFLNDTLLLESSILARESVEKPRSLVNEMGREAVMLGVGGATEGAILGGLALRKGGMLKKGMMKGIKQASRLQTRKTLQRLGKRIGRDAFGASLFGAGLGAAQHGYDVKDYKEKQRIGKHILPWKRKHD